MTSLPLRELLGIFVRDLIIAETRAAEATADFLRNAGFQADGKPGDGKPGDNWGQLRFVTFSFTVEDPDGRKMRTVRVPLLSLLPIPLQQIDLAEYEFFAKVNEVKEIEPGSKEYELSSAALGPAQPFLDLMCEVAPYSQESALENRGAAPKVRVKLTMRQADLPAGLSSSLRRVEQASGSETI